MRTNSPPGIEVLAVFPEGSGVGVITRAVVTADNAIRLLPPYHHQLEPYEVLWQGQRWSVEDDTLRVASASTPAPITAR